MRVEIPGPNMPGEGGDSELTAEGASDSFTLEMESPDGDTWCVSGI